MENVRLHRRGGADAHECTKFGDIVTVDTMVLHGLKDRGVNGETDAVVFYDLATKYIDVLPVFSRSVPNTVEAFHKFMGPEPKIGLLYSDQAREFLAATRRMAWVHHMSTPGMPKTNGIIENKVKLVLHGARVLLRQAGLSPKWWPFAVRAFCAARNLENRGEGTAWGKRNDDRDFPGQLIPFGCLVDFKPIAPKPRRLEKGGSKTPPNGMTITKLMKFLQKITGSSMKNLANSSECTLNQGLSYSKLTALMLQSSIFVSPLTVIHGFSMMRKMEK